MDRDHQPQDWVEPLTPVQWIIYAVAFFVLFLQFRYMWTWCQWFTNCPKT